MDPLPPRFLDETVVQLLESGYNSLYDFLNNCRFQEEDIDELCAVCWQALDTSEGTPDNYRKLLRNDKCHHVFHEECLFQIFAGHLNKKGGDTRPSMCPYKCCKWCDAEQFTHLADVAKYCIAKVHENAYIQPILECKLQLDDERIYFVLGIVVYAATCFPRSSAPSLSRAHAKRYFVIEKLRYWLAQRKEGPEVMLGIAFVPDDVDNEFPFWMRVNFVNLYLDLQGTLG